MAEATVYEMSITDATEGKVARSGCCCLGSIANSTFEFEVAVVGAQIGRLVSDVVSFKFGC